eukprot:TRINITY_DN4645_c0_g1_i2.p1 TRINITY_DN4645_c0_g1~~TRINITY_DN4645_c0_g1_i2.p1  ORF type:complete len:843 (-),score=189.22 TRINITY_DN4645_c0_g1_i2:320-2848(-)
MEGERTRIVTPASIQERSEFGGDGAEGAAPSPAPTPSRHPSRWRTLMATKRGKAKLGGTVCCFSCGACAIGCSFFLAWLITASINFYIIHHAVVDSTKSFGYTDWVSNHYPGYPLRTECYTLFNLSNADEFVAQGALPIVDEVGPYCYQIMSDLLDVDWTDDGDRVTFNEYTRYWYMPSRTNGSQDDVIININPAYSGVVVSAFGERTLSLAFMGPSNLGNIHFMKTQFLWDVVANNTPPAIAQQSNLCVADLEHTFNLTRPDAQAMFCKEWASAAAPPTNNSVWEYMLSHSETSSASCLLLFDPSMPLSLASTAAASTSFWSDLVNVCSGQCVETPSGQMRCPGDQPPFVYPTYPAPPTCNLLLSNLSAAMNMSTQQASAVVQWLGGEFLNPLVREPLKEQFGVDDFEDLAYVQWGARRGVSLTSLADIYPGVFPIPPEYIKATDQVAPLNVTQCKKLLDGAMGINNMTHLPYFAEALAEAVASNQSTPLHPWGVDATEAEAVSVFWALGDESFSQQRLKDNIFPAGGGLITSRTVEEIMFYAYDPLLLYANPSDVNACIVCNFTSPDHCREKQLPSVYNTGKKNISLVAWTEQFEMSEYVYGYPEPYRVRGTNEIGQYEPFTQDDDDHHFPTFDNDYMRVLDLVPHGDVTLKGIPSRNYAISNETWAPNPAFDQSIQGFTNMAGLHNGSQIFLSNPHMWLANQSYIDKVTGMLESDYLRDGNSVVIEPISGAVLSLYVGIQVNMYMPKEQLFGLFHPNVTHDVMVPLVIAVEETVLTDAQANLWKYTIGLSQSALPYLYWGLLALGAFAVVAGTGMGVLLGLDLTTVRPTHDMAGYDLIY